MSNIAVDLLIEKRNKLHAELMDVNQKYGAEIRELDSAIRNLTGESISEIETDHRYDDENPDYIKNTEDGI